MTVSVPHVNLGQLQVAEGQWDALVSEATNSKRKKTELDVAMACKADVF
jgi:hypothetical protein